MTSRIRVCDVLAATVRLLGLPEEAMTSPKRLPAWIHGRQIAMTVAVDVTGLSVAQVGHLIGGRYHRTVLNAMKITRTRMRHDPSLVELYNLIREEAAVEADRRIESIRAGRVP